MAHLGSFASSLAVPEALRPWAQSGLAALFVPGGLSSDEDFGCEQATEARSGQAQNRLQPEHGSSPVPGKPDDSRAPAMPSWPEPWRGLASRVREHPKVIITYMDLAVDLSGTPHPGRRKLMRDILGYLAWPLGTSLFWPMCSLRDGRSCPAPDVFSAGVRHFGPRHVVCFGADAHATALALFPPTDDEQAATILGLPAPAELIPLLPHELHKSVKILKALVLK